MTSRFLLYRKLSPIKKSPPGRIALRRRGIISLKRSAAGGESCAAGFYVHIFRGKQALPGAKNPISGITQARADVGVRVQAAVQMAYIDLDIRVGFMETL